MRGDMLVKHQVKLSEIRPPHEVRDTAKLESISASMQHGGWKGRSILAEKRPKGYQAWTGSHRIAAAKKAGLKTVPVVLVNTKKLADEEYPEGKNGYYASGYISDDEDRVTALKESGQAEAANLMQDEIDSQ